MTEKGKDGQVSEENMYGSAPIFLSSEAQRAWDSSDETIKKSIRDNLSRSIKNMENRMAIEIMACVINDMREEIEELKKKVNE